jgi:hypothetical protein
MYHHIQEGVDMIMKIDEINIRHSPTISLIDEKVGSLICEITPIAATKQ